MSGLCCRGAAPASSESPTSPRQPPPAAPAVFRAGFNKAAAFEKGISLGDASRAEWEGGNVSQRVVTSPFFVCLLQPGPEERPETLAELCPSRRQRDEPVPPSLSRGHVCEHMWVSTGISQGMQMHPAHCQP